MSTSSILNQTITNQEQALERMKYVFALQQAHRQQVRNTDATARRRKLQTLKDWMMSHQQEIREALFADFQKPAVEADITEIFSTKKEIEFAQKNLSAWMKPRRVSTPLALLGARSRIMYEPKGVSLIMAPWNYPFYLVLSPLVSAIAAGCTAMVKPSEMTPHTAGLLNRMLAELFPEHEVAVFEGDYTVAEALLTLPFNHIFSPEARRLVRSS